MTEDLIFGLVVSVPQLILIALLIRRNMGRRFRYFLAYLVYSSVLASAARAAAIHSPVLYFKIYWTTEILYGLLAMLAVFPIFVRAVDLLRSRYRRLGVWAAGVILAVAGVSVWWAIFRPLGITPLYHLETRALAFTIYVRFLEVGMFALCLRIQMDRSSPVSWKPYDFGILEGFAISAFLSLLPYLLVVIFKLQEFETVFRYSSTSAYSIATGYWLIVFFQREPPALRPRRDDRPTTKGPNAPRKFFTSHNLRSINT